MRHRLHTCRDVALLLTETLRERVCLLLTETLRERHTFGERQSPAVGKPYQEPWTHMQRLYIEVLITVLVLSPTVLVYAFESAVITNY